ncbi:hypothetical protein CRYUN_Cryun04dG0175600 [Craigia yunnanensis]
MDSISSKNLKEGVGERKRDGEGKQSDATGNMSKSLHKRVELVLNLKGIPYEYVEEYMFNKSPLVFKYNPVYKRLPILVHNGNLIVECLSSLNILMKLGKMALKFYLLVPTKEPKFASGLASFNSSRFYQFNYLGLADFRMLFITFKAYTDQDHLNFLYIFFFLTG